MIPERDLPLPGFRALPAPPQITHTYKCKIFFFFGYVRKSLESSGELGQHRRAREGPVCVCWAVERERTGTMAWWGAVSYRLEGGLLLLFQWSRAFPCRPSSQVAPLPSSLCLVVQCGAMPPCCPRVQWQKQAVGWWEALGGVRLSQAPS